MTATIKLGASVPLAAQQELAKQGLGEEPPRPKGELPELPDELTELRDRELMSLMTRLNRWANHLGYQLSAAQVDEQSAEQEVETLQAFARSGIRAALYPR